MTIISRFIFLFVVCLSIVASAQTVQELIAQGDKLSMKEFNNAKALDKYLLADKQSKNNWEILWRISRTYVYLGQELPSTNDQQKQAQLAKYQEGLNYANRAVQLAPDKSITYLRRAIVNGRIALFKGVFTAIGLVNDVKADIEKAIQLNNGDKEIMAACHYVLGRTHAKVCEKSKWIRVPLGLGWGDIDVALKEFQKAVDMRPEFKMYHLDYAKALISEKEWARAKEQLSKIPALPKLDEEDDAFTAEAKSLLEQIKNK
jgi:tetratricopeptide (TPR) repeat protein